MSYPKKHRGRRKQGSKKRRAKRNHLHKGILHKDHIIQKTIRKEENE